MPEPTLWNASLSTMWAMGNFRSLEDFFITARRLGFAGIELNHQVDPAMLAGIDLTRYSISSIHEPCPAILSVATLKARDWFISSTQEENRKQGVISIKRSIDLASSLGTGAIVVHAGNVRSDWPHEKLLYDLFKTGRAGAPEYQELKSILAEERARLAGPRLETVQKSLLELLEYARPRGVQLGLENRYHYMDIPSLDEMGQLLALGRPDHLGFWYDVGHAQALDRLGFFPHAAWLQQYGMRMVGIHLHDVIGIQDHNAPGTGDVAYTQIADFIPANAVRTLEIKPGVPADQIQSSLQFLAQKGCIRPYELKL